MLISRIPDESSFTVRQSPGRGLGLFATEDTTTGSLLLSDPPLLVLPLHQLTEAGVSAGYARLSKSDQRTFDLLARSFASKLEAFQYHKFVSFVSDAKDLAGFCVLATRANHSCEPNVTVTSVSGSVAPRFRALRDIRAGEEIVFNYLPPSVFLPTASRRAAISRLCYFHCRCNLCESDDVVSDMRRRLSSALLWLAHPALANAVLHYSGNSDQTFGQALVVDQSLVKRCLQDQLSTSQVRIFAKLAAMLLEADGVRGLCSAQIISDSNDAWAEAELHNQYSTNIEATVDATIDQARALETLEINCGFEHALTTETFAVLGKLRVVGSAQVGRLTKKEYAKIIQKFPAWNATREWMIGYGKRYQKALET